MMKTKKLILACTLTAVGLNFTNTQCKTRELVLAVAGLVDTFNPETMASIQQQAQELKKQARKLNRLKGAKKQAAQQTFIQTYFEFIEPFNTLTQSFAEIGKNVDIPFTGSSGKKASEIGQSFADILTIWQESQGALKTTVNDLTQQNKSLQEEVAELTEELEEGQ